MRYLYWASYAAIPLAFVIHFWLGKGQQWASIATFVIAAIGVLPLAHLLGRATEALAHRAGPTWGGLLNATFGNAAELIIGIVAVSKGLDEMAKASLTGSVLSNLLLIAGGAMVVGGWKRKRQTFSPRVAETNSGMLALAVAMMLVPAIFHHTAQQRHVDAPGQPEMMLSIGVSVVMIVVYVLGLLFTLRTHRHIFTPEPSTPDPDKPKTGEAHWTIRRSVLLLLAASAGIAVLSELLVGSAEHMSQSLGWNHVFVGVILLAIIGNAAEHSTAILLASHDDMNTAMSITYQSSIQIALFVTPLLVLISLAMVAAGMSSATHLDLVFTPMEVIAVGLAVLIVITLGLNGETNWFEGALLLALYVILGIAFFDIPVGM